MIFQKYNTSKKAWIKVRLLGNNKIEVISVKKKNPKSPWERIPKMCKNLNQLGNVYSLTYGLDRTNKHKRGK